MGLYDETKLLQLVAGGDQQAFAQLIDKYTPRVYAHVRRYMKDAAEAEEITQDIFLNVWKKRDTLTGINNFSGYLFIITRNKTISAFRRKMVQYDELDNHLKTDENPIGLLEYRELHDILQEGIGHLPPKCQQVFVLSRFEDKTYDEIAAELSISKSAVNKHIMRALEFLRTFLADKIPLAFLAILFYT